MKIYLVCENTNFNLKYQLYTANYFLSYFLIFILIICAKIYLKDEKII